MSDFKIYFAASVYGGREDADLYASLIEHLKQYGEVLTEQLGMKDLEDHEDHLNQMMGGGFDSHIYKQDVEWLDSSDLVVAEVSTPSLGVGYELGRACSSSKDVLCLYREGSKKKLSLMVSGNEHFDVREYTNFMQAVRHIDDYMKEHHPELIPKRIVQRRLTLEL